MNEYRVVIAYIVHDVQNEEAESAEEALKLARSRAPDREFMNESEPIHEPDMDTVDLIDDTNSTNSRVGCNALPTT